MFENIKSNQHLRPYLAESCCENDICIEFEENIPSEDKLIIKVDDYYNALPLGLDTPPSPDCLILVRCNEGGYSLHIVELKNITTSKGYDINNLTAKFDTCIYDFIEKRFPNLLHMEYKTVKLYFVSRIDHHTRDMGLKYELLMGHRINFNGKRLLIRAFIPTPKIKHCY
ncbi:hypothetical protein G6M26_02060 [Agrobacterium tumefaciens]|nr:hypothetical protein [Agrobacterium tumefaciens]NTE17296.1 hypothetical protein [Agrobacterium tumefaciens]